MKKLFIFLASVFLCFMMAAPASAAGKDTLEHQTKVNLFPNFIFRQYYTFSISSNF